MHCELLIPALFPREGMGQVEPPTAALRLLLARGRRTSGEGRSPERWLLEAFGAADAPLAAGALTVAGTGGDAGAAFWCRADPVHLQLGRDSLSLVPADALAIAREEADALCLSLSRHFPETLEFVPGTPARWCARLAAPQVFSEASPVERAGADVDERMTSGEVPSSWHAFLNEAQMLLHTHPVNEAREARGARTINSLWLWGSGEIPGGLDAPWASVSAEEPIALGLARVAGTRALPLAASATEWMRGLPGESRHLVVLDALRPHAAFADSAAHAEALAALERDWFEPLLEALRANRIGMVSIRVPDTVECQSFETVRSDLRRIWRRPRALSAYAAGMP